VIETIESAGGILGPVYDMRDVFADEQYAARDDIVAVDDDEVGTFRTHGVVPKFSRTPGDVTHAGPPHGAHNVEVYSELGLSPEEIAELEREGIV
jgi:formyl-CoA transferase